ncbi:EI24 domain-containing protein [Roseomonas sp. CCTCC AB2023176]|uniref:EI24 domain-containing protein n=1 Tax=Roseomonas sp. CCTCC AB2023176 TaxID=3342640 RepID=UPI0035E234A0
MKGIAESLALPLGQLGDRGFVGPLLGGFGAAVVAFGLLTWGADAWVASLAGGTGWLATALGALGGLAVIVAAYWLFVPVTIALAGVFLEATAAAVERRHYPGLPPARGASLAAQAWFNIGLGAKVLLLNLVLLPVALVLPPVGAVLFWFVAAVFLGRGLFEGVAQRRMTVAQARSLRRARNPAVMAIGAVLATMSLVPILNLLLPVYGTAAMTHLLHRGPAGPLTGPVT